MKNFKNKIAVFIAVVIVISIFTPVMALASARVGNREITSQGAIVMDFETGITLYGHNEDTQRVPASMIKMLTVYVIYDAIKAGEISFDTVTRISRGVSEFSRDTVFVNIFLPVNLEVTIKQLLEIVLLRSANAATVALAEALSGSESAFVSRMRQKAIDLGIDLQIHDCFGGSPNNRISPRGMADLVRNLITDHPDVLDITSMRTVVFRGTTYTNSNSLLGTYRGMDGVKTGFTTPAGNCFTGTAVRDGRRIISVTMGSTTSQRRFQDTEILLDYGFQVADTVIAEYYESLRSGYVNPSSANLIIDGVMMPLAAYNIGGYHYFKLRDIAYLLNDTEKQFSVTWDAQEGSISLYGDEPYIPVGGELDMGSGELRWYTPTSSRILFNGVEFEFEAYFIEGNNYFMLRELAPILDLIIDWDAETSTVIINTFDPDDSTEESEESEEPEETEETEETDDSDDLDEIEDLDDPEEEYEAAA